MRSASLPEILAFARAGAGDHAWKLLMMRESAQAAGDPATLNLKARLLKDQAGRAEGIERQRLYREAAAAYRRSAGIHPATYPLINAASVGLLAGNREEAEELAAEVLRRLDAEPEEPDTPYWQAATRAEALLLLGRDEEGRDALRDAIASAPQAWEDHAATLRQFRLVLGAQARDASWIDQYRPPTSLHFGGHMSFDAEVVRREQLSAQIAACLDEERVGFGYGALAAGADIIIAEALIARGAELNAVLPGGPEAFAAESVDPFGESWRGRFDALIEQAASVRTVRPKGAAPDPRTIGLADEIAMGAAVMNARRLESEATQLLVADGTGGSAGGASGRAQAIWAASGRRQRLLQAPREALPAAEAAGGSGAGIGQPLAIVAIMACGAGGEDGFEGRLDELRELIAEAPEPQVPPYWTGERVLLAQGRLRDAADLALALARRNYRVGADYLAAVPLADPFSGGVRLGPAVAGAAEAAAASTPEGSACVTEDFAAALAARGGGVRCEFVGELEASDAGPPIGLYALR